MFDSDITWIHFGRYTCSIQILHELISDNSWPAPELVTGAPIRDLRLDS